MIISKSINIPAVDVEFSFGVESMRLYATGILDTGCNMIQIPLGVLIRNGVSKDTVNKEIERLKLLFARELVAPESSGGASTPSIITCIHNVVIDSHGDTVIVPSMAIRLGLTVDSRFVWIGHDLLCRI